MSSIVTTNQQRIGEVYALLKEADDLDISVPGLEQELAELEGEPLVEALAEGEETPAQQYRRIRQLRDLQPTYSMLEGG